MSDGFYISALRVLSNSTDKPPAEVLLEPGLNVITGPTDTGKTFVFKSITFMLGGADAPVSVEFSDYETFILEVTTFSGKSYTLKRQKGSEDTYLYDCRFSDITDDSPVEKLSRKHSAKKSISKFLFELIGFSLTVPIRVNKDGQTNNFSFRLLEHFVAVDELRVITDQSIIQNGIYLENTRQFNIFRYLITGQSESSAKKKSGPKAVMAQSREAAQAVLYDELIEQLVALVQNLSSKKQSHNQVEDVTDQISKLSMQIERDGEYASALMKKRNELIARLEDCMIKSQNLSAMIARFELLKSHYSSDLSRLDFISEGHYLLRQLQKSTCPTCGQGLIEAEHLHSTAPTIDEHVQVSCRQEALKIQAYLKDLEVTFDKLSQQKLKLGDLRESIKANIDDLERGLQNDLRPTWSASKAALEDLLSFQRTDAELQMASSRLSELRIARAALKLSESKDQTPSIEPVTEPADEEDIFEDAIEKLCKLMQSILKSWNFSREKVFYDEEKRDFNIGIKPRSSYGKGSRSVVYAAFLVGILWYCRRYGFPHPGMLLIDSPLTSRKDNEAIDPDDEVSIEVQDAFFEKLAAVSQQSQVIILDNKEPKKELFKKINVVVFTREKKGRYGFFPIPKDSTKPKRRSTTA